MKLIFVASDFSGLGKGTFSASLGRVLESFGINARIMKCDLYFNYDAGTINPGEHGEVYVLADGTETDQDFGIYERFLGQECNARDYLTSGRVFHQIYLNERGGKYLGQTVSVEHVIEEIKERIRDFAQQCEVGIIELGATIGDIKGIYFLEACRQLRAELSTHESLFVLLSHFPFLQNVGELKTMGCQRSVNDLRSKGLKPDVIIARTVNHADIPEYQLGKIEKFCEVPKGAVCCFADLDDEYRIPELIRGKALHHYIATKMDLNLRQDRLDEWYKSFAPSNNLKVALVGKYHHPDAYVSIIHQLRFVGVHAVTFLSEPKNLETFDAVILPGGWGERGVDEIIEAARICRERQIPCLGICLGLQLMVLEYARNVLGLSDANSLEFDDQTSHPVVRLQDQQYGVEHKGASSRLGNWTTELEPKSRIAEIYDSNEIIQRHRHRYEISSEYSYLDFRVVGRDKETGLIEAMELSSHPFYIGVQYHPEFSATKVPLFDSLVNVAMRRKRQVEWQQDMQHLFEGTPGTYLENIDMTNEDQLRELVFYSDNQLEACGISKAQQMTLASFLKAYDEKREHMDAIQADIDSLQLRMRDINLRPDHLDGAPLSRSEVQGLDSLRRELDAKKQMLHNLRLEYEVQFVHYDDKLREMKKSA